MRAMPLSVLLLSSCLALAGPTLEAQVRAGKAPQPLDPKLIVPADLGLPALPPLTGRGTRSSLLTVDRLMVQPDPVEIAVLSATGTLIDAVLDKAITGTGFDEYYQYQLPPGYDSNGPGVPLLIAYHGFGSSAAGVSLQTTLDEMCALRGWVYLAVTGVDDKLFGTAVSQQNIDALVNLFLQSYAIDADRIYMVGFSVGAGVVCNYAARHRDPDGIMIAAVGLVAGSYDWTTVYNMEPSAHTLLLNPYNFGATPTDAPFAYQAYSALHFASGSYPPSPGTLQSELSLATNLADIPLYISWDSGDSLTYLPGQSSRLQALMDDLDAEIMVDEVTGTVHPIDGTPATHSWAVLDEAQLFHFLDGRQVDRHPTELDVQLAGDSATGFLGITQRTPGAFSYVTARVQSGSKRLLVERLANAQATVLDLEHAGLTGLWPIHVETPDAEPGGLTLAVRDPSSLPGYLVDEATGELLPGTEWDPDTGMISVDILGGDSARFRMESPPWNSSLSMKPDPVGLGESFVLRVNSEAAAGSAVMLVLSPTEMLFPLQKGLYLAISPMPPAVLLPLALDANGDLELTLTMPNWSELAGARLPFQGALVTFPSGLIQTTNPFALNVD
jgi:pimeloyl-ACP methyl ester carboxylesterase